MKQQKKGSKGVPIYIKELIEEAQSTRLYIVKRTGPTYIKYCDDNGHKFKVDLSEQMTCSCNSTNNHCIHTIHALLKIYRVDPECPLLWRTTYSPYDIDNILNGLYKTKTPKKEQRPNKQQQKVQQPIIDQKPQPQLNPEDLCPICQESLICDEALVYCKLQCNNYFHAKCMKVWVLQKQTSNKKIACPMCRVDWGEGALVEIRNQEKQFEIAHKIHKKQCQNCKVQPIIGSLYLCIQCPNYTLCNKCYLKRTHIHQIFMYKSNNLGNYELCDNIKLEQLWMMVFPDNLNHNNKYNDLMLVGTTFQKQSKCDICQKCKNLKSLPCGHIIGDDCLKKMAQNNYVCPLDQKPQFVGYFNQLSREIRDKCIEQSKIVNQQFQQIRQELEAIKLPPISKSRKQNLSQRRIEGQKESRGSRQLSAGRNKQIGEILSVKKVN